MIVISHIFNGWCTCFHTLFLVLITRISNWKFISQIINVTFHFFHFRFYLYKFSFQGLVFLILFLATFFNFLYFAPSPLLIAFIFMAVKPISPFQSLSPSLIFIIDPNINISASSRLLEDVFISSKLYWVLHFWKYENKLNYVLLDPKLMSIIF